MPSDALDRFQALKPWVNVSEEDLYRVGDLYLSVRGNVHGPPGVWCTSTKDRASRWIAQPNAGPGEAWVYDAQSRAVAAGGLDSGKVESALSRVLDQFEGKPHSGVEFPIFLNPPSPEGQSLTTDRW